MVADGTKQNVLVKENILKEILLHTGDFVLEVNGKSVPGNVFEDDLTLFAKDGSNSKYTLVLNREESRNKIDTYDKTTIACILIVDRERKVIQILDKLSKVAKKPKLPQRKKRIP